MTIWSLTVLVEYDNSSVGEEEHFELRHIWETLLDWQVWAHILIYMSIITPRESSLWQISQFGGCSPRTYLRSVRHLSFPPVSNLFVCHLATADEAFDDLGQSSMGASLVLR